MRLLNTKSLELEHFLSHGSNNALISRVGDDVADSAIPRYAILSHTWGKDEVIFQDMQENATKADYAEDDEETIEGGKKVDKNDTEAKKQKNDRFMAAKAKTGWKKLEDSCDRAASDGYDYIWIDTCCIDKSSSAELSEAINSMFQWYRNSAICYVFLEDCTGPSPYMISAYSPFPPRWYSRGWMLQELIAPNTVHFYSSSWQFLGTKEEHATQIARVTGIDLYALLGGDISRLAISRRMSWAWKRQTTRPEDMAYCLLGIFDVSMPLLYGEGFKAFTRLQEEIMKGTDDQSLFVWREDDSMDYYREDYGEEAWERNGLLAFSPAFFASSAAVSRFYRPRHERPQSVVTSQGLTVSFLMCQDTGYQSGEVFLAVLDCQIGRTPGVLAGIRLRRVSKVGNEFVRIDIPQILRFAKCSDDGSVDIDGFDPTKEHDSLVELQMRTTHRNWKPQTIRVSQSPVAPLPPGFWFIPPPGDFVMINTHPRHLWDSHNWILQSPTSTALTNKTGALHFRVGETNQYFLIFGTAAMQSGMKPWCVFEHVGGRLTLEQYFNYFEVNIGPVVIDGEESPDEMARITGRYWGQRHWDVSAPPYGIGVDIRERKVSGIDMIIMKLLLW